MEPYLGIILCCTLFVSCSALMAGFWFRHIRRISNYNKYPESYLNLDEPDVDTNTKLINGSKSEIFDSRSDNEKL